MIAADKRVLEATLSSRTLAIQGNLLKLYLHNIYAISLIAALIGEMVWDTNQIGWPSARKFTKNPDYDHDKYPFVQYMFYSLNGVALIICFYVLGVSAIYSMWGPIMATNGHDASAVRRAAALLKENQYQIFVLMNIVYILILVGTCFFLWSLLDSINAAVCTFMMVIGAVVVVHYGFVTVRTFDPDITLERIFFPQFEIEEEQKDVLAEQQQIDSVLKKIKYSGTLYMVNTLHEGSLFTKYFASLEKGMLCIYKNEEEYQEYEAPVLEPFVMSEYRLVLDPQEIRMTSENPSHGSFRKRLSGHSNLTYLQSFELGEAAQKYVFNLVPKASHEYIKIRVGEFMAEDQDSFRSWTNVLDTACIAGEKVIRHGSNYMQGDSITVELAAKAADMYNLESREKSAKLKKNIFLENSAKRDPVYEDGSLVLVSFDGPVPETGRRPSVVWKGPFTVVSKSLSGMYQLRGGDGVVHEHPVDRLKPFKISDLK